jgi:hypothetical protein
MPHASEHDFMDDKIDVEWKFPDLPYELPDLYRFRSIDLITLIKDEQEVEAGVDGTYPNEPCDLNWCCAMVFQGTSGKAWASGPETARHLHAESGHRLRRCYSEAQTMQHKHRNLMQSLTKIHVLAFLIPNRICIPQAHEIHHCSTSPWSILAYRKFPRGSTMVLKSIEWTSDKLYWKYPPTNLVGVSQI